MKGKRKVTSHKWSLQTRFAVEASRALAKRSRAGANRFLDAALVFGKDFEPTGCMAGVSLNPTVGKHRIISCGAEDSVRKPNLVALLPRVIEAVLRAGQLLVAEWERIDGPRGKGDKAVVDVEIEVLLREQLLELIPCDFWGEETGHRLTGQSFCWVVDPNDGTCDFLKGLKGSALSVGLLCDHTPVLGVVFAPITVEGVPDCIAWAEGLNAVMRNGKPVTTKLNSEALSSGAYVMVSSSALKKPGINAELCSPCSYIAMPSIAYRLAKVAAGDGICGVSLYPVSAHDVAAGHALLKGAGGVLFDERGETVSYVTESGMKTVSQWCFGGSELACRALVSRNWGRVFSGE
jgi:myo-inositol-1(or 4)-monophosphatase